MAAAEKAAEKPKVAGKTGGEEKDDEQVGFMMLQGPQGQPSFTLTLDEGVGRMTITRLPGEDYVVAKAWMSTTNYYLVLAPKSRFNDKWELLEKDKMLPIFVDEAVLTTWEKEVINGPKPADYVEGKGPLIKYLVGLDAYFLPTTTALH